MKRFISVFSVSILINCFVSCSSTNLMSGKWKVQDISPLDPSGYDNLRPEEIKGLSDMENQYDYFVLEMKQDSIFLMDQDKKIHQKLQFKNKGCNSNGICKYRIGEEIAIFIKEEDDNVFEFRGAKYTLSRMD